MQLVLACRYIDAQKELSPVEKKFLTDPLIGARFNTLLPS